MNRPVYPTLFFALLMLLQVSLAAVQKEEIFTNDEFMETPTNDQRRKEIRSTMASLNQAETIFATLRSIRVPNTLDFSWLSMWQKKKKTSDFHRISEDRISKVARALTTKTNTLTTFHKPSSGPCDDKNSAIIKVLPKAVFSSTHVARAPHILSDTFDATIGRDYPSTSDTSALPVESSPEPHDSLSSKRPGCIPLEKYSPSPSASPIAKIILASIIDIEDNNLGNVGFPTDLFQRTCSRTCKRKTKTICRPSKKNKVRAFKYCSEGDAIGFKLARTCCFYEACFLSRRPQGRTLRRKWRRFVKRKLRNYCG